MDSESQEAAGEITKCGLASLKQLYDTKIISIIIIGFQVALIVKNLPATAGDTENTGLTLAGKIPE